MSRKMGIGAVLAASAVALSGCIAFAAPPTAKLKNGNVVITVKACASRSGSGQPPGSCASYGNAAAKAHTSHNQVLLGFLVPSDAEAPQSFSAKTGPASGGPKLSFTKSSSYTGQLASLAGTPAGQKWIGYWSRSFSYHAGSGQQNFTAKPAFGLPKNFSGEFTYKAVVGRRYASKSSANAPVNCFGSLTTLSEYGFIICEDDSASGSLAIHR